MSRNGFTLADVLMAATFFLVAVLGVVAALASGERLATRVRATVHASLESRDAIARLALADTVCPAPSGSRGLARGALAWGPGPLPATRLVTVVVQPAFPTARPESTGTVVGCS